jgi:ABC-2 type transport system permease protein
MTTQSKSSISHDLILAARQGLLPAGASPWLGGFGNMLRKELSQWWGTRVWWVQILIWVFILNGITTIVALADGITSDERLQQATQTFIQLSAGAIAIGTVITAQGAIVGEKQLGTAAWVISKPASRSAFILAKLIAYALGFWVCAMLIPTMIFFFGTLRLVPASLSVAPFLSAVALVALCQLFYLVLTLALGAFFDSRGPIAGIGIAMAMTGLLLKSIIPIQFLVATPWVLFDLSGAIAIGAPLPPGWNLAILSTTGGIVIMVALALWRFGREEF